MIGTGLVRNPFAAARFAPGVVPWLALPGADLDALADRALAPGARHQLVGPHGSGKSTLLVHLERQARRREVSCVRFRGSHGVPWRDVTRLARERRGVLLLDEAEELASFAVVALLARLLGLALVASTHRELGLPTLLRTHVDAALASRVLGHVAPDVTAPADLAERLARNAGNLRDVFFELYDEAERGLTADGATATRGSGRDATLGSGSPESLS